MNTGGDATAIGLALTLAAGLSWAGGNIVAKAGGPVNMLAYVVWASIFSVVPLAVLSLAHRRLACHHAKPCERRWLGMGRDCSGSLSATPCSAMRRGAGFCRRHPAGVIVPTALLVPVFGMASSSLWLGEPLPLWKIAAAALVLSGLALNMLWPVARFAEPRAPAA